MLHITYSQFESPFHILNITIHTKDLSQHVSKTSKIISHNCINIIGQNLKTSRVLKFINQFSLEHQLVHKTNNIVFIIVKGKL